MRLVILQLCIDLIRRKIDVNHFYRKISRHIAIGDKIYNYHNCKFDEIISLGYNCEISARLEDIFNYRFNHFVYSWSYENDRDLFLKSLCELYDNFSDSTYSLLPWGMLTNDKYKIDFHSKYKEDLINNKKEILNVAIKELRSRTDYLARKLDNVFKENKKILFIIKIKYKTIEEDINFIKKLYSILKEKYENSYGSFLLLVVLSKKNYPNKYIKEIQKICSDNLHIKTVKDFARDDNALSTGDIAGWIKLIVSYL